MDDALRSADEAAGVSVGLDPVFTSSLNSALELRNPKHQEIERKGGTGNVGS